VVAEHSGQLRAAPARHGPAVRVLDVAIRQGLEAGAALVAVGPPGSVVAADISGEMVELARERLGGSPNAIIPSRTGQWVSLKPSPPASVQTLWDMAYWHDQRRRSSGQV
jgi:hypothetical protein